MTRDWTIERAIALRLARKDAERAEFEYQDALDVLRAARAKAAEKRKAMNAAQAKLVEVQEQEGGAK